MKRTTDDFASLIRRLGRLLQVLGLAGSLTSIVASAGAAAGAGVGGAWLDAYAGCEAGPATAGRPDADETTGCMPGPRIERGTAGPDACPACEFRRPGPKKLKTRGYGGPHGPGGGPDEASNR